MEKLILMDLEIFKTYRVRNIYYLIIFCISFLGCKVQLADKCSECLPAGWQESKFELVEIKKTDRYASKYVYLFRKEGLYFVVFSDLTYFENTLIYYPYSSKIPLNMDTEKIELVKGNSYRLLVYKSKSAIHRSGKVALPFINPTDAEFIAINIFDGYNGFKYVYFTPSINDLNQFTNARYRWNTKSK